MNEALAQRSGRIIPSLIPLDEMVAEAVAFLREHEPPEGYFVGFSGGKDSIVALELCRIAEVKHEAFYSCTLIDPPEIYRFIKEQYPGVKWLFPKRSFWKAIQAKSPPTKMRRWCCDDLKKNSSKHIPLRHRVMGIRAEESRSRASRPRIDDKAGYRQILYKPIFRWQEWHVWEFIDERGLPYPELYEEGFERIGCVVCPFLFGPNHRRLNRARAKWPGMFRTLESACRRWWDKKHAGCIQDERYESFEAWLDDYYTGFDKRGPAPGDATSSSQGILFVPREHDGSASAAGKGRKGENNG